MCVVPNLKWLTEELQPTPFHCKAQRWEVWFDNDDLKPENLQVGHITELISENKLSLEFDVLGITPFAENHSHNYLYILFVIASNSS